MSSEAVPSQEELTTILQSAIEAHRADRKPDAEKLYMRVLRFQPRNAEALNLLGVLAAQTGDHRRARELIKAAMAEAPDSADYRFQFAHVLQLSGQSGVARAYREALQRDPRHLPSLVNLGNLLLDRGELEEATTLLSKATEVDPTGPAAFEALGLARHQQGRLQEAAAALERAIALDPGSAMAQARLGTVLLAAALLGADGVDAAIAQLRQAAQRFPGNAALEADLGTALLCGGDPAAALAAFEKALTHDPRSIPALAGKPLAHRELGDDAPADRLFDFDRLLAAVRVTTVPGCDSVEQFNEALAAALRGLTSPTGRRGQTGELLADGTGVVATFGQLARQAAQRYFAQFTGEATTGYPLPLPQGCLLQARGLVLGAGERQSSHIHPGAVVSGLYVVRSGAASADDPAQVGALLFGEGPETFKLAAAPKTRAVAAEEGLLLLFPSYLWQRSAPLGEAGEQITIAFDVIPLD